MPDLPIARSIRRKAGGGPAADRVTLGYDERFLRRKRLVTDTGAAFLADLAETTSLEDGDLFELEDGRLIAVAAAAEPLVEIRGDLARLAWHIGNRHTPCQIGADKLTIRQDPVLAAMLTGLGARLTETTGPFTPEGGAYGHGRTMGHEHGADHVHHHASAHGAEDLDEDLDEDGEEDGEPEAIR
jgi:urease accessory protein